MIRLTAKGLLAVVWILLLTACWDRRELDDLSIAVAMGLDEADGGQYLVSVQLVNPSQIASKSASGPESSPVSTFSAKGRTVFEALRKMTTKIDRRIYMAHLRTLIIGERLAREGISEPIDFMSRSHEMRTDFHIAVAKGTRAEHLLTILTPQESIPANKLYSSLHNAEKYWAATGKVTLDELIKDLESEGKNLVLPGLFSTGPLNVGSTPDNIQSAAVRTIMQYNGLAVFKGDKLQGWLNGEQSQGYNFTQDAVQSTVIVSECGEGEMDVELKKTKTSVKGSVDRSGDPVIRIHVYAEANVGDIGCRYDLSDPESIRQIEGLTSRHVKEIISDAVRSVQSRYRTDIFGFGDVMHRSSPKRWKKWRENWDRHFTEMSVQTVADIEVRRIGTINEPVRARMRK